MKKIILSEIQKNFQTKIQKIHKICLTSPNRELLEEITGQKARPTYSKRSIPGFKVRQNQLMGYSVTLRRKRMQNFAEKFFHVTIPSNRTFRGFGLSKSQLLESSQTIGLNDSAMFHEKYSHIGFQLTITFNGEKGWDINQLLPSQP